MHVQITVEHYNAYTNLLPQISMVTYSYLDQFQVTANINAVSLFNLVKVRVKTLTSLINHEFHFVHYL